MADTNTTTTDLPQQWDAINNLRHQLLNIPTNNLNTNQLATLTQNIRLLETTTATSPAKSMRSATLLTPWTFRRPSAETPVWAVPKGLLNTWADKTTGMGRITGALDPERFETIINAIEAEMRSMANTAKRDGSTETLHLNDHLAASALVELISHGNGAQGRPNIVVITDEETLTDGPHDHTMRQTRNGQDLSTEAITRLCCDAVMQRVTVDAAGVAINVGRTQRTATPAQWAALNAMHSTCAWAGCGRPISWCQAHHILEWDPDGLTDLDNLVPLCSTHHHRAHEGRWNIKLLPDRTLKIYQPDGTHYTNTVPDRLQDWLASKSAKPSTRSKDRSSGRSKDKSTAAATAPPSPKPSGPRGPKPKSASAKSRSRTRRASDRQPSRQ